MEAKRRVYLHAEQTRFFVLARLRKRAESSQQRRGRRIQIANIVRRQMQVSEKIYYRLLIQEHAKVLDFPYPTPVRRLSPRLRADLDLSWKHFIRHPANQVSTGPSSVFGDDESGYAASIESLDDDLDWEDDDTEEDSDWD